MTGNEEKQGSPEGRQVGYKYTEKKMTRRENMLLFLSKF